MEFRKRPAVSKIVLVIALLVLVGALAAIEEITLNSNNVAGSETVDLHIYEDDPVLQIDHFYPDTIVVPLNETLTLAVQNLDDETRVFTLTQFNINVTIVSGTTQQVSIRANKLGNFSFISPIAPPSVASQGRKGPCLEGFFLVTQNSTLLSTTTTGTGVAPSLAQVQVASNGPVGTCSVVPLTVPPP